MKTSILRGTAVCVILAFISLVAISPAHGAYGPKPGPTPIVFTDKAVYCTGDPIPMRATLSYWNFGGVWKSTTAPYQTGIDIYVGLWTPFGTFYTLDANGAWAPTLPSPCLIDQTVGPDELNYAVYSVLYNIPPTTAWGKYALATVLTGTGSTRFASEINAVSFWVVPPSVHHYYVNGDPAIGDNSKNGSALDPWLTITHALNHALTIINPKSLQDYVTIHVAPGTYSQTANGETFPLSLNSYVYLRGQGADVTILNAEGAVHVIKCSDPEIEDWSVVDGFTIKGGHATDWTYDDQRGGGVYCPKGYKIVLQNNIIKDNVAEYGAGVCFSDSIAIIHNNIIYDNEAIQRGGAIECENAGGSIVNNTIRQNKASHGAGIFCKQNTPQIQNNVIADNKANESGGGIHCDELASPLITGNLIEENEALGVGPANEGSGGGIFCIESSSPEVRNNVIRKNVAQGDVARGGGICCVEGSSASILNNVIFENKAAGSTSGSGGGIYFMSGIVNVVDCTVRENIASSHGGGIFCEATTGDVWNNTVYGNIASSADGGGIYWGGASFAPKILSNTIVYNHADLGSGGGIWSGKNTSLTIKDCIIYKNSASSSSQLHLLSSILPSYCCIENWSGGGTDVITDDPVFRSGPYGDYYLNHGTPKSKCIDAGSQPMVGPVMGNLTTNPDATSANQDTDQLDIGCHYPRIN